METERQRADTDGNRWDRRTLRAFALTFQAVVKQIMRWIAPQRSNQTARGGQERPRHVRKLTGEDSDQLTFFIDAPMRSAEHLMKRLYADDTFYQHSTFAWIGADDAKKLFLYGVCKEVFKACIGLMNDQEVIQEGS